MIQSTRELFEGRDIQLDDVTLLDDDEDEKIAIVYSKTPDVLGLAFTKRNYVLGSPSIVDIVKEEVPLFEVMEKALCVYRNGAIVAWKDGIKIFDNFYRQILPILKPGDEMFYPNGGLLDIYRSEVLAKRVGVSSVVAHHIQGWASSYWCNVDLYEIDKPDYTPEEPRELRGVHEIRRNGVVIARRAKKKER